MEARRQGIDPSHKRKAARRPTSLASTATSKPDPASNPLMRFECSVRSPFRAISSR